MNKEAYLAELSQHFGSDLRRINHANKVLAFAEKILDGENPSPELRRIVIIAAILHDVGIKLAEQKYKSAAGPYQELEGPPIAEAFMRKIGESDAVISRVCYIIGGHHTYSKNNGIDFQIIWEADLLVNIEEDDLAKNKEKLKEIVARNFKTKTGKRLAAEEYLI